MSVVLEIVGYDRSSEMEVASFRIPPEQVEAVKSIALIGSDDDDGIGAYPILAEQAECILSVIGVPASELVEGADYFLETHTT